MFSLNSVNILLQMPIYCQQLSVFLSNKSKFIKQDMYFME